MKTHGGKKCEVCPSEAGNQTQLTELTKDDTLEDFKAQVDAHLK